MLRFLSAVRPVLGPVTAVLLLAPGAGLAEVQPERCVDAIKRLEDSPELRAQGGAAQMVNARMNARVYLQLAAQAAAEKDEARCWVQVKRAEVVLIP